MCNVICAVPYLALPNSLHVQPCRGRVGAVMLVCFSSMRSHLVIPRVLPAQQYRAVLLCPVHQKEPHAGAQCSAGKSVDERRAVRATGLEDAWSDLLRVGRDWTACRAGHRCDCCVVSGGNLVRKTNWSLSRVSAAVQWAMADTAMGGQYQVFWQLND